jgi:uncharacterized damage-inducible protein DinB
MLDQISIQPMKWFERQFSFGLPLAMLPFYLDRLEGTIYRLEARVKGVPEEVLSKQHDGKWSIKQNIGHLAEVDEISTKRIDEMMEGMSTLSPAVFEPRGDYNAQSITDVLHFFRNTRLKNLVRYHALQEEDLPKASMHPRLRVKMTPVDLAWFDAEHDDHHLVTIHEILKKR